MIRKSFAVAAALLLGALFIPGGGDTPRRPRSRRRAGHSGFHRIPEPGVPVSTVCPATDATAA